MERSVRTLYSSILEDTLQTQKSKITLYVLSGIITFLLVITVIEVKHIYEINLFPNYDFKIDNVYFEFKEWLGL